MPLAEPATIKKRRVVVSAHKVASVINGIRLRGEYRNEDYSALSSAIGTNTDRAERKLLDELQRDMTAGTIAVRGMSLVPRPTPWSWSQLVVQYLGAPFVFICAKLFPDRHVSGAAIGASMLLGATASIALAPLTVLAATLVTAYANVRD